MDFIFLLEYFLKRNFRQVGLLSQNFIKNILFYIFFLLIKPLCQLPLQLEYNGKKKKSLHTFHHSVLFFEIKLNKR